MVKEKLIRETLDWAARSEHESRLAFREGDVWAGIVWGSKVRYLRDLAESFRAFPYDDALGADPYGGTLAWIVERLDPVGLLKFHFGPRS